MLLNPADYTYQYFKQPRDDEGDSGAIYLATPKKRSLCKVLVKSFSMPDAINEFIGCNIGQGLGVNTPKAWLFRTDMNYFPHGINFYHAVGIEYLDGFDDSKGGSFESEDMAIQTIRANLMHIIMAESDQFSLAQWNGKVYAFDFADSIYSFVGVEQYLELWKSTPADNGFTEYQREVFEKEINPREKMRRYFLSLIDEGVPAELVYSTYSEMRDSMMKAYGKNGFTDLVQDIAGAYSDGVAQYAADLMESMYNTLVDFPIPEGDYIRTPDGVLIMTNRKKKKNWL